MEKRNNKNIELTVIIVSFNTEDLLSSCIDSIIKYTKGVSYEIIIVDNASTDGSARVLQALEKSKKKNIKVLFNKHNLGFAKANNQAAKLSSGEYLLFLNSDTYLAENSLNMLVKNLQNKKQVGIASPLLKDKSGNHQEVGGYFPNILSVFSWMTFQDLPLVDRLIKPFHPLKANSLFKGADYLKTSRELDWVAGTALFIQKKLFKKLSGFDTDYFMYTEDVDLCFRANKLNYQTMLFTDTAINHLGGASSDKAYPIVAEFKGIKTFFKKHRPVWQQKLLPSVLRLGVALRTIAFTLLGKSRNAKIYAEALSTI